MTLEGQLLRSVMRALQLLPGCHPMRRNAGLTIVGKGPNRRAIKGCEPGTPDIAVMLNGGRMVWLELKTAKGRLSRSQVAWHEMAAELNHVVVVARSVDEAVAAVREAMG